MISSKHIKSDEPDQLKFKIGGGYLFVNELQS